MRPEAPAEREQRLGLDSLDCLGSPALRDSPLEGRGLPDSLGIPVRPDCLDYPDCLGLLGSPDFLGNPEVLGCPDYLGSLGDLGCPDCLELPVLPEAP